MIADLLLTNAKAYSFGRHPLSGALVQIAVTNGKVSFVGPNYPGQANRTIDLQGAILTRRLWDIHAHVGNRWGPWGWGYPGLENLIEVVLDAGTVPPLMAGAYVEHVIKAAEPHFTVGMLVSVSRHGLCSGLTSDYRSPTDVAPSYAHNVIVEFAPHVFGTKARVDGDTTGQRLDTQPITVGISEAQKASDRAGKPRPFMLHHSSGPDDPPIDYLLGAIPKAAAKLTILTHAMRGIKKEARLLGADFGNSILDANGVLRPCVERYLDAGGRFDQGNGMAGNCFTTHRAAYAQGARLHFASTDYHSLCWQNVRGLLHMAGQFLALGLTFEQVLELVLKNPTEAFGMPEFGEIAEGSLASFAVFTVQPGAPRFVDGLGEELTGSQLVVPHLNIREGKIIYEGTPIGTSSTAP